MLRLIAGSMFCAAVAVPVGAQDQAAPASTATKSWGLGVMLSPLTLVIDGADVVQIGVLNFLVPIRVAPNTTIEPEFGMTRWSADDAGAESSASFFRVGVGILAGLKERGGLRPYVGPRIAIARSSTKDTFGTSTFTESQTTWSFSGVAGAQHYFSPHFSLGGEVQLTRASAGESEISGSPGPTPSPGRTVITTAGVVIVRWFF